MKFRIYRRGSLYLPQYSHDSKEWKFFTKSQLKKSYLCLGILGFYKEQHSNYISYEHLFLKDIFKEEVLGFIDLLTAHAFLGAASYFYSNEKIEFNLNLENQNY